MADTDRLEQNLKKLGQALIDQSEARVIVAPQQAASGYWFGGGNMVEGPDGALYVIGRYRNAGDSRVGVSAGTRGLELAVFRSGDNAATFEKVLSFQKSDLNQGDNRVLSIEGSAIRFHRDGVELFVSTEKDGPGYPAGFDAYLKPGTGVWTIDRLQADSLPALRDAAIEPVLSSEDPEHLHVKDPFLRERENGDLDLLYCTHPFSWSSSNTSAVTRRAGEIAFSPAAHHLLPRGTTWDVAMSRGTCLVRVPEVGVCAGRTVSLMFYDGGECVRNLDEHAAAVRRPRGYSCEELGGLAWLDGDSLDAPRRLSPHFPLFVSPHGTGCSRYVDVLPTESGWFATWQQSQPDESQPLVCRFLSASDIQNILSE